jgi:signal peptidase I
MSKDKEEQEKEQQTEQQTEQQLTEEELQDKVVARSEEELEQYENDLKRKKRKISFWGWIRFFVALVVVYGAIFMVTHYLYSIIVVNGESMESTLFDQQIGIIKRFDKEASLQRGDIVIFYSDELEEYLVKRCVALPNDTISMENGVLTVNGEVVDESYINEPMLGNDYIETTTLKDYQFFAMGDNRNHSYDCRELGPVDMDDYMGKLVINLGAYGITRKRIVVAIIVIFALLLLCSFIPTASQEEVPEEFAEYPIEMDSSTCTGEMVIGFRNKESKKLELMELVRDNKDIEAYCKKYGREYKHLLK